MLKLREGLRIYINLEAIDMRKAINGLTTYVVEYLEQSPQSGDVYLFFNKNRDKVKMLFWDRNGFVLYYKRMERSKFKMPKLNKDSVIELSEVQLQGLLAGFDFMLMDKFSEINYSEFF